MKCLKCGKENSNDARFCGSCGFDMSATQIQNMNIQQQTTDNSNQNITNQPVNTIGTINTNQPINTTPAEQPMQPNKKNEKNNTLVIVIIGIVIALAIVLIIINCIPNKSKNGQETIDKVFNPEQLIKVRKDGKYGYINTKGKFVTNKLYDEATNYYGEYAIIQTETKVDGVTKTVSQIIDKKGKTKVEILNEAEYIEKYQLWLIDEKLYNNSIKQISPADVRVDYEDSGYFVWVNSKENTGGIMNENGKITYTYKFKEGENYISIEPSDIDESLEERYCRVNIENENYAIVNCDNGKVIYDYSDKYVSVDDDNIFQLKDHETYDLYAIMYIQKDKIMYQSESEEIDLYYYPGYLTIRDGSKNFSERYSYLDTTTGKITTEEPTNKSNDETDLNEWESYTGTKKFNCSTGYGLMNDEKVTLTCEWNDIEYLDVDLYKFLENQGKNYIYGKKENKWNLIDLKTKKPLVEFNSSYISTPEKSTFIYYTDKDTSNKKIYNLLSGKSLSIKSSLNSAIYSNYITVNDTTSKTLKYYNTDLELIYTEDL